MPKRKNKKKEVNIPIKIFNNKQKKSKSKINNHFSQSQLSENSIDKKNSLDKAYINKKKYFSKLFDNYSEKKKYFIMYSGITIVMFLIFASWIIFLKHNFQNNNIIISKKDSNFEQLENELNTNFLKMKQRLQQTNEQINKLKTMNNLSNNLSKLEIEKLKQETQKTVKSDSQLGKSQEVNSLIKNIKNKIEKNK